MKDHKYYAWANNDQGASLDVYLPMSERRHSIRAFEDAARNQLGSGWTVHIMRVDIDGDGQSVLGEPHEAKTFTIRPESKAAAALGRTGGISASDAKAAAARENGKRGGRPRKASAE